MRSIPVILFALMLAPASAQEVCNNGMDDDGDSLIDLNDTTDCVCTAVINVGGGVQSIIPNPSFEVYDCLPTSYSQLDCADTWAQATNSTSDFFYTGSYMPYWIDQPLPGGGNGCVGGYICPDYMEYIGACLLEPMVAGTSYSLNFFVDGVMQINDLQDTTTSTLSAVDITLWGYGQCPSWPIGAALCPEPSGWTILGTVSHTPTGHWTAANITFTPTYDVQAVMIGSPCVPPADYPSVFNNALAYFLYDGLTLNQSALFSSITITGACTNNIVLTGHPDTLATSWQWYHEGVALVGQTDSVLAVSGLGSGTYQFLASANDTACVISSINVVLPPVAAFTASPQPTTPDNTLITFTNTSSADVVQWQWNFDTIPPFTSAQTDPVVQYPAQPGVYPVSLIVTNGGGCTDTTLAFVLVEPVNDLDMPNVFSPNGDGHNDLFIPLDEFPGRARLSIFNRWGQEIFITTTITNGWNGTISGSAASDGTYYWIVENLETNADVKFRSGHVTLVR